MVEGCKIILENMTNSGHIIVQQKQRLVRRAQPFTLKNGELYKMGQDNRLRQCLTTIEA
jgi:hypothetical protein